MVLVINRHDDAWVEVEPEESARQTSTAATQAEAPVSRNSAAVSTASYSQAPRLNADDRYFLIVASLASLEEAQKFVASHRYQPLEILTIDGRFRVYAATGNNPAETLAAARGEVARNFPNAWVCRR